MARASFDLRRLWPLIALVVLVAAIALIASFAPTVLQRRVTQALVNLVAVVGLYVFVGNSGVLSFGNVAFMAVGAYVSALLTMRAAAKSVFLPDLPAFIAGAEWLPLPGALAGGSAAALMALLVGLPLMRLSGISASIATFAVLVITYVVLGNWTSMTGGQNSLMGLPLYVGMWTALAWAIAAIVIAFIYQETSIGADASSVARGRGCGASMRRLHRAPPADCVRHQRLSLRSGRRASGALPRDG